MRMYYNNRGRGWGQGGGGSCIVYRCTGLFCFASLLSDPVPSRTEQNLAVSIVLDCTDFVQWETMPHALHLIVLSCANAVPSTTMVWRLHEIVLFARARAQPWGLRVLRPVRFPLCSIQYNGKPSETNGIPRTHVKPRQNTRKSRLCPERPRNARWVPLNIPRCSGHKIPFPLISYQCDMKTYPFGMIWQWWIACPFYIKMLLQW